MMIDNLTYKPRNKNSLIRSCFRKLLLIFALIIFVSNGFAQQQPFKLFLIGDAGERDSMGLTLKSLHKQLTDNPNSAVLFLGDNAYKKMFFGLISLERKGFDGGKTTCSRVGAQLNSLKDYKGAAYFVPGNHDWWNMINFKHGSKKLKLEENYIEDSLRKFPLLANHNDTTFLPMNGSPGPDYKDLNNGKLRIIFIDTQRLIMLQDNYDKGDSVLLKDFYKNLENILSEAENKKQKIFVVGHHPVFSKGLHSGPLTGWEKLFKVFGYSNVHFPAYFKIAAQVNIILKKHSSGDIYYASGHEHSLEYFIKDHTRYIISGAGSKTDYILHPQECGADEYLTCNEEGFFEVDIYDTYDKVIMYHGNALDAKLQTTCMSGCK